MSGARSTRPAADAPKPASATHAQALMLLEQVALTADSARFLAMDVLEALGDSTDARKAYALQRLIEYMGALAESGLGFGICGSLAGWACGSAFGEAGQAAAAAPEQR